MKKLIGIVAALVIGSSAFAIDLGLVGGLSINSMTGTSTSGDTTTTLEYDSIIGGKIGAAVEIPVVKVLSIQPEVLFHFNNGGSNTSSFTILGTTTTTTTKYSFNSIEFPILAKTGLSIGPGKLSVLVGPSFTFLIGNINYESQTTSGNSTSKSTDTLSFGDADWNTFVFGLDAGLEYAFKLGKGKLGIGCMFDIDLTDIAKSDDATLKCFAITPQVTYMFGL
ncbi:MAG: PorT family protein [Treponema sp.]|nr:PorT family protein [Treponema sp.]